MGLGQNMKVVVLCLMYILALELYNFHLCNLSYGHFAKTVQVTFSLVSGLFQNLVRFLDLLYLAILGS